MASNLLAMASNLLAMASNLIAMASNLIAMASTLIAMASTLIAAIRWHLMAVQVSCKEDQPRLSVPGLPWHWNRMDWHGQNERQRSPERDLDGRSSGILASQVNDKSLGCVVRSQEDGTVFFNN